ncbi:MAG TPA: sugar phosphate isomerase/epimerase family protein [Bryobacteraceae bacterium]|nr:sugar phosphate isomerase/epimerase family protein [Bryobacteraceae bacterium]
MARHDLLLHSVSYAGLWGQEFLDVEAFVHRAANLGFDGVMLMAKRPHVSVLDYDASARLSLRRQIEAAGLRHITLAGYSNLTADLDHGEVPQRELQTVYITQLAQLASDLGAPLLRIYTGYEHPAASYAQQWKLVVATLRECARSAAALGVTLGVQNHHDIACDYRSLHDLLREVNEPNCRAMFDAWSPGLQGTDLAEAARTMGSVTAQTTVADYQLRPRFRYDAAVVNYVPLTPAVQAVPMGEGFLDYTSFFRALQEGGFAGPIAYEMCSPLLGGGSLDNLDRYARRFIEYMKGHGQAAG